MKAAIYLLALAGLALFVYLLAHQGISEIWDFVKGAGWGLLLVSAFHIVPMAADTIGWWKLFPNETRPQFLQLFWIRWIGESVNGLLPAAQVGGEIVRARLVALRGVPGSVAAASVVAKITVGVFTQAAFTLLGVALLAGVAGGNHLIVPIIGSVLTATVLFIGFYLVQRIGMFKLLGKLASRLLQSDQWKGMIENGNSFDAAVRETYGRKTDVAASAVWTMIGWVVGAGEIWIALMVLGAPVDFVDALILESLSQAVKGAMFLVPGALGFQEVGFILIGSALGIPAPMALALSLTRRFRDISLGVPGLVAWQVIEGRRLLRRDRSAETK
ncbi:MAG: flippase-like domain-containing protein [Verrucomicrobia bacterium]|nr:flippase-like domain-containing protein [Verrucomicrobiota bacterium]